MGKRRPFWYPVVLLIAGLALVAAVPASADNNRGESDDTPGRPAGDCQFRVEVVSWTGTDWLRYAQALAANRSACAEYWVSIPPLAANKKGLRVLQDDLIRALGIHPVAEFSTGEITGWGNWVNEPGKNRTWFDAGVEFRIAMASAGYDVTAGETYLINEFDRTTARDAPREGPTDHVWPPMRRADMRDLMRGLYYGLPGMPTSAGLAEIGIHFRHQNIPNVAQYRLDMQGWLTDAAFWADVDRYVRWIGVENYADSRLWAPEGSSLKARARHLDDYIFHLLDLVRSGPRAAATAESVFERKFLPLANAGWRARGGDEFSFRTGHGNTILDDVQMQQFVSEQVYAIRRYAGKHHNGAPAGRLGFSWQPCNRLTATQVECGNFNEPAFISGLNAITTRLAQAIRDGYEGSAAGACTPQGTTIDWCQGSLPGAAFIDAWDHFRWLRVDADDDDDDEGDDSDSSD